MEDARLNILNISTFTYLSSLPVMTMSTSSNPRQTSTNNLSRNDNPFHQRLTICYKLRHITWRTTPYGARIARSFLISIRSYCSDLFLVLCCAISWWWLMALLFFRARHSDAIWLYHDSFLSLLTHVSFYGHLYFSIYIRSCTVVNFSLNITCLCLNPHLFERSSLVIFALHKEPCETSLTWHQVSFL